MQSDAPSIAYAMRDAYADASLVGIAPADATDGRTDGLTEKHSPDDEISPSVTRAGGPNESTSITAEQTVERFLEDVGAVFGERADVVRWGEREPISQVVRRLVFRRDGWKCQVCGRHPKARDERRLSGQLHLDHIVPWSAGGSDRTDNLRTLCHECNMDRGNRVTGREKPVLPIVGVCIWCHPRLTGHGERPADAIDVYCASKHHQSWALRGWKIL